HDEDEEKQQIPDRRDADEDEWLGSVHGERPIEDVADPERSQHWRLNCLHERQSYRRGANGLCARPLTPSGRSAAGPAPVPPPPTSSGHRDAALSPARPARGP